MPSLSPFETLPYPVLSCLVSHLTFYDFLALSSTSHTLRRALSSPAFYQCIDLTSKANPPFSGPLSAKESYFYEYATQSGAPSTPLERSTDRTYLRAMKTFLPIHLLKILILDGTSINGDVLFDPHRPILPVTLTKLSIRWCSKILLHHLTLYLVKLEPPQGLEQLFFRGIRSRRRTFRASVCNSEVVFRDDEDAQIIRTLLTCTRESRHGERGALETDLADCEVPACAFEGVSHVGVNPITVLSWKKEIDCTACGKRETIWACNVCELKFWCVVCYSWHCSDCKAALTKIDRTLECSCSLGHCQYYYRCQPCTEKSICSICMRRFCIMEEEVQSFRDGRESLLVHVYDGDEMPWVELGRCVQCSSRVCSHCTAKGKQICILCVRKSATPHQKAGDKWSRRTREWKAALWMQIFLWRSKWSRDFE